MAKKIKWTERAQQERLEILEYWANRNKSKTYSFKLNRIFLDSIEPLANMPELGKSTEFVGIRIKVIHDYLIYYSIHDSYIEILTIWDSRRNPNKFKL